QFAAACGKAVLPILTPAIIVGGIVGGLFTPTEASVVAVLYAMLLGGLIYRTLPLKVLRHTFYDSARFASIALFCIGTASAIVWVISVAYGLVTPHYGLCLMIACSIGGIKIKDAVRDTAILFIPMLLVLLVVILFPDLMLWLPRKLMPAFVK